MDCPGCGRDVAVAPVVGRPTKGQLWRHDAPAQRRDADGMLVSCRQSLAIVERPWAGRRMELTTDDAAPGEASSSDGTIALF